MEKIADFRIQITRDNGQFTLVLTGEGDDFDVEVEDPAELVDEVEELINEQLAKYGVQVGQS